MTSSVRRLFQALPLILLAAVPLFADDGRLALASGSRLWLNGDSTLHAFSSTATALSARGEAQGPMADAGDLLGARVSGFELAVPVRGLKSGKNGLDKNMYGALKAEQFPEILFRMRDFSTEAAGEGRRVRAAGTLTVAGETRDIVLEAEARAEPGRLRLSGEHRLRMSDFGVKPPVMMMGAVKTRDEVAVGFDIFISRQVDETTGGNNHEGK